jgi:hypothetical protein
VLKWYAWCCINASKYVVFLMLSKYMVFIIFAVVWVCWCRIGGEGAKYFNNAAEF